MVLEECAPLVAEAGRFNERREDVLRTYRDQIWPVSRYSAIVEMDQASIRIREWTRRSRLKMNRGIEGVTENPRTKGDDEKWVKAG